ncbi:MAG: hypothetical protein A2Y94_14790 [Caldithrix sp. RBG_13_44_9]|nr:MAG: hypothetical protein A2Y94_14790 [Caldithrix sp. RBG_13_44_9]
MIPEKKHIAMLLIFFLSLLSSYTCKQPEKVSSETSQYLKEIADWRQRRITNLTKSDGWLSLIGLFWLKEGKNSYGGNESNSIQFTAQKVPAVMGNFILNKGKVTIHVFNNLPVLSEEKPVQSLEMQDDQSENPTVLTYGSLSWLLIKRGDKYGIRLRDSENDNLKNFKGIENFPVDPAWKVEARFEPYSPPKKISVPNVLGTVNQENCPGALVFKLDGRSFRLDPIAEEGARQWFIIFSDETNGPETYGAGRFLYIDPPDENGKVIIDFNKTYNPPCAFTIYATCPLPPEQNHLAIRITAGEKKYQGSDH